MGQGSQAWQRTIIHTRERPVAADLNTAQAGLEASLLAFARALALEHHASPGVAGASGFQPAGGFLGDALFPYCTGADRVVRLCPGLGFVRSAAQGANVGGIGGLDDREGFAPVYAVEEIAVPIPAAPSTPGTERFDLIEVCPAARLEGRELREVLPNAEDRWVRTMIPKVFGRALYSAQVGVVGPSSNSAASVSLKSGAEAPTGSGEIPPTSPGYCRVAVVRSVGGQALVSPHDLRDDRRLLFADGRNVFALHVQHRDGIGVETPAIDDLASPAGLRFTTPAVVPGAPTRIMVFGAEPVGVTVDVTPDSAGSFPSGDWLIAKVSPVQSGILTTAVAATLPAGIAALVDDRHGQPFWFFDIARRAASGADWGARYFQVRGGLRP